MVRHYHLVPSVVRQHYPSSLGAPRGDYQARRPTHAKGEGQLTKRVLLTAALHSAFTVNSGRCAGAALSLTERLRPAGRGSRRRSDSSWRGTAAWRHGVMGSTSVRPRD